MALEDITRPAATSGYRPAVMGGSFFGLALDGRPPFTWLEAERMRLDPQVQFGLRILRTPLYGVTWKVKADSAKAEAWIDREMGHVYRRVLPRLCRAFEYGVACGEVTYRARKSSRGTRVHFHEFLDVHPQDVKPHVWNTGRRAGQMAALTVRNVATNGPGGAAVVLDRRHGFWFRGEADHGAWYGRPRLAGAYQPWFDKGARFGANDMLRLYYRKGAFSGPKMRYPVGFTDYGTAGSPDLRSNQDIAREIAEKFESGGVLALPNVTTDKGEQLWQWEDPKAFSDVTGLIDYKKLLDRDILIGLGIPPELVDAATVGSGYSGRAIPAQVFFGSMDEFAALLIEAIDKQIIRPLVRLNFGRVGYTIEPESLAKLIASAPPGGGPPAPGMGGATPGAGDQSPGPMQAVGPRGGHRIIDPRTGKVRYGWPKGKARLSLGRPGEGLPRPADDEAAEARRLWDEAGSPVLVEMTA